MLRVINKLIELGCSDDIADFLKIIIKVNHQKEMLKQADGDQAYYSGHIFDYISPCDEILRFTGDLLVEEETVVDIGCGIGIPGLYAISCNYNKKYIGLEINAEKIRVADILREEFHIPKEIFQLKQIDLSTDFVMPKGDIYYMYSPTTPKVMKNIVNKIPSGSRIFYIRGNSETDDVFTTHKKIKRISKRWFIKQ